MGFYCHIILEDSGRSVSDDRDVQTWLLQGFYGCQGQVRIFSLRLSYD